MVAATTRGITDAVGDIVGAVGYGGIAYGQGLVHCRIDGVAPTEDNVRSGAYPISRYLYLCTVDKPVGLAKEFIDWVLSPAGQRVVAEVGYVALWTQEQH